MAGNLLRTHYDVEAVQDGARFVFSGDKRSLIISQLETLKGELLQIENQFYASIGKSKEQFREDYKTASARMGSVQAGIQKVEQEFVERYATKGAILDRDKAVQDFLDKINEDLQADSELSSKISKFGASALDVAFETIAKNSNGQVKFTKGTTQKTPLGDKKTALASLNLKIDQKRKGIVQKVDANNDFITNDYIKKLQKYVEDSQENGRLNKVEFLQEVIEYLSSVGLTNLANTARVVGTRIGVNASEASIRGFFGELYALATLEYLYGDKAKVISTGAIKKESSGQQIPIDIVLTHGLQQFNFQVKNYRIKKNSITLSNTVSAVNFVQDKLELTGTIADILIEFFASYQYNKPFTGKIAALFDNSEMPVPVYEEQVYNQFQQVFNELSYLFNEWAANMFKIEDVFKANSDGMFSSKQQYFNNFFIVQDRILPASDIIQQIIDGLNSEKPVTHFTLSKTKDYKNTLQGHFNDRTYLPPLYDLAKLVDIRYSVTIRI